MNGISNYKPGDETHILKLFSEVFGREMSVEYWKWRFLDNPAGETMIKLYWENGTLVAHYAVSPVTFLNNDKVVSGALSMTTMTHPQHLGKGYFTLLAEELYADFHKQNRLDFVYGFPNMNSHYGFVKKLKWENIERIPMLIHSNYNSADGTEVGKVLSFTDKHEKVFTTVTHQFTAKLKRSAAYLNWRYLSNPAVKYHCFEIPETNEYIVCKLFNDQIDVMELICEASEGKISCLLSGAVNQLVKNKVVAVNTWMPMNDSRHIILEKLGFGFGLPVTWLGYKDFKSTLKDKDLYYSLGDSDVF